MNLTFNSGQFFLASTSPPKLNDSWIKVDNELWVTKNLKAAAQFRRHSDDRCEKVFNRAFNKYYDAPSVPPLLFLDPHQIEGVKWILSRSRSYLAHAPGAGKTAQAIVASILAEDFGQTLFIVPPSLSANWIREIETFSSHFNWWPEVSCVPLTAKKDYMDWSADFIVCPDSMLSKDWVHDEIQKRVWKLIAVDEASRFKEQVSERSIVFYGGYKKEKRYSGIFQDARHTVFLDGSPMPNRACELWAPAYALDPLAIDCMDYDDFGFRYGGAALNDRGQWEYKGTSHEAELKTKLQKSFMHVVTEDKLSHPERRRSILMMTEDVRTVEHKTWEKKHLDNLSTLIETNSQGELAHFRQELGRRKVNFIGKYMAERLAGKNESILLFVWHRDVAQMLETYLQNFKPGLVIGGTKSEIREKIFEDFQSGRTRLIIGNIQAMGRGHNLQRADRVIFGEFSWTNELNLQCEKRASRRGRDHSAFVRCEYICAPNSIDEKVLNSVFVKEKRVKKVIG